MDREYELENKVSFNGSIWSKEEQNDGKFIGGCG